MKFLPNFSASPDTAGLLCISLQFFSHHPVGMDYWQIHRRSLLRCGANTGWIAERLLWETWKRSLKLNQITPPGDLTNGYQKWCFGTSIYGPGIYIYHIYIYVYIIEKDQVASLLESFIIIQKAPGFLKMVATTSKVAALSPKHIFGN